MHASKTKRKVKHFRTEEKGGGGGGGGGGVKVKT